MSASLPNKMVVEMDAKFNKLNIWQMLETVTIQCNIDDILRYFRRSISQEVISLIQREVNKSGDSAVVDYLRDVMYLYHNIILMPVANRQSP